MKKFQIQAIREFEVLEGQALELVKGGNGIVLSCHQDSCNVNSGTCIVNTCSINTNGCIENACALNCNKYTPPCNSNTGFSTEIGEQVCPSFIHP